MANIKSQIKRNRQNDAARERNKAVRSALKTKTRHFRTAADSGDK
jgi:small subunit ribosomal protein S20